MNGAFLIGGLVMLALGAGVARHGLLILRGGADRLRSARARAIGETAAGGTFALIGVTELIGAFIGNHRLPTLLGMLFTIALLALFALAGSGWVVGRVAARSERRHAKRVNRELGIPTPRELWPVGRIGLIWAGVFIVAVVVSASAWGVSERVADPSRSPSQQTMRLVLVVLLAVIGPPALVHIALQWLRLHNRAWQLAQPATAEHPTAGTQLMARVPCPPQWCSREREWERRINWHRRLRTPVVRLAQAGVSPVLAAPPLPGWATDAWIADATRCSVALWRVDLACGEARIETVWVARPGKSSGLGVMRTAARHPALAGLALVVGLIAAYVAWRPGGVIYAIVVSGILGGAGVIAPLLRDDCRTAVGERLGKRGERALADLRASGEDLDAWRRLWTALPVPRKAS